MKPLPGGALLDDYNWRPTVPASGLDEPGGETPANISGREYPGAGTKFAFDWPGVGELDLSGYVPPEVRRFAVGANALLNPIQPGQTAAENAGWLSLGLLAAPFRSAVQKAAGPASVDAWRNITRGAAGGAGLAALAPEEAQASPRGWWSVLEEAIRGAPGKMPAEQWTKYLAPGRQVRKGPVTGSLKSDELEYSGLQEILDRYSGKSIEPGSLLKDLETRRWPEFSVRGDRPGLDKQEQRFEELGEALRQRNLTPAERQEWEDIGNEWRHGSPDTQYESYLTPGPKTGYQENLTKWAPEPPKKNSVKFRNKVSGNTSQTFSDPEEAQRYFDSLPESVRKNLEPLTVLEGNPSFTPKAGHFNSEPNLLSHSRASVRQAPDGRRVRLVEEIQSDWHQQARDEGGYRAASDPNRMTPEAYIKELEDKYGFNWTVNRTSEENEKLQELLRTAKASSAYLPPRAPFQQTYPELELKKQLAQAIESGDEYLAWTPGEEQIRRYSDGLQRKLMKLDWEKTPEGKYNVKPLLAMGYRTEFKDATQNLDDKALRNLVGKEMADKIMAGGPQGTLQGGDLKIGGAGMRHFYDTVVRQQAEKLAKQYGGELTEVGVPGGISKTHSASDVVEALGLSMQEWREATQSQRAEWTKAADNSMKDIQKMPAIRITDEMRRRFREAGGFPVWSVPAGIMSWEELMEPAQGED